MYGLFSLLSCFSLLHRSNIDGIWSHRRWLLLRPSITFLRCPDCPGFIRYLVTSLVCYWLITADNTSTSHRWHDHFTTSDCWHFFRFLLNLYSFPLWQLHFVLGTFNKQADIYCYISMHILSRDHTFKSTYIMNVKYWFLTLYDKIIITVQRQQWSAVTIWSAHDHQLSMTWLGCHTQYR